MKPYISKHKLFFILRRQKTEVAILFSFLLVRVFTSLYSEIKIPHFKNYTITYINYKIIKKYNFETQLQ